MRTQIKSMESILITQCGMQRIVLGLLALRELDFVLIRSILH